MVQNLPNFPVKYIHKVPKYWSTLDVSVPRHPVVKLKCKTLPRGILDTKISRFSSDFGGSFGMLKYYSNYQNVTHKVLSIITFDCS